MVRMMAIRDEVKKFKYLMGIMKCEGNLGDDINERIGKTGNMFNTMKTVH